MIAIGHAEIMAGIVRSGKIFTAVSAENVSLFAADAYFLADQISQRRIERQAIRLTGGFLAGEILPALHSDIDVLRIEFHQPRDTPRLLGSDQSRTRSVLDRLANVGQTVQDVAPRATPTTDTHQDRP
ncbi:MAG: hypothetical protein H6942_15545 [Candidatus Accumulibacter sp.]|nr:hypothetical protein [Accumulibacter sp.]